MGGTLKERCGICIKIDSEIESGYLTSLSFASLPERSKNKKFEEILDKWEIQAKAKFKKYFYQYFI